MQTILFLLQKEERVFGIEGHCTCSIPVAARRCGATRDAKYENVVDKCMIMYLHLKLSSLLATAATTIALANTTTGSSVLRIARSRIVVGRPVVIFVVVATIAVRIVIRTAAIVAPTWCGVCISLAVYPF